MKNRTVSIFYGEGKGKSTAAIGQALRAASQGKMVVIIQFLKGKGAEEFSFIKRLEPEVKCFAFEKSTEFFDQLSEEQKKEEAANMRNGLCFARKVLTTREADVVILDEILGVLDNGLITLEDIFGLIEMLGEDTELILSGRCCQKELLEAADEVSKIERIK